MRQAITISCQDMVNPIYVVATVSVFSEWPAPEWSLSSGQAAELHRVWSRLRVLCACPASPPALGYRGISMRWSSGDEWHALRGVVTHIADGWVEWRKDEGRQFEKALLATAPPDAVPAHVAEIDELIAS
jgi:hypothetical protein